MDQIKPVHITIRFHHYLRPLLYPIYRKDGLVELNIRPWASIKDVVESLQVPHPEIGMLLICGKQVGFSYQVRKEDFIDVLPLAPPVDPCKPTFLRPEVLTELKFMVDVNVARLGALLRMAGFDTAYMPNLSDTDIAKAAESEGRVLLSRDRGLLKRKIINHGHLVRSQRPEEQLAEIVHLYDLGELLQPFSRCMQCNGLLATVEKSMVFDRLEPLTRKYYKTFYLCSSCDKIYWAGSHKKGMDTILATLKDSVKQTGNPYELKERHP